MALFLLCDEHIPNPVVEGLRRRGLNVVTVQEIGLSSKEDKTIMDRAREEGRIIYTRDADFLRLHQIGHKHVGIFYHHPLAYSIGEAIRKITMACEVLSPEEMKDNIKFL
ncbi:MAG: DUF5615 family PIN-like protein [Candidatus Aerophobetes bacterium]|nr:DUF5615 family PIN-like protein [Candidatus Aerophobetes bacterium]